MLTVQRPLLRSVLQDMFDRIRAAMVFQNAFPSPFDSIKMITDNLIIAAESNSRATNIYNRLIIDGDYTTSMSRLVSLWILNMKLLTPMPICFQPCARIPLFRAEVKDRCVAIVQAKFLAIQEHLTVIRLVKKQLSNYNYSFPRSTVSVEIQVDPR